MKSDLPVDFTCCESKRMVDGYALNKRIEDTLTSYKSVHNHCLKYSTLEVGTKQIKLYQRSKVYAPYTVA